MIASLIEYLTELILYWISVLGYPGVVFLMTLESAGMPIPSEIVMPFSGFLVYQGQMNLWLATLAGTLGNLIGSVIAYFIGLYGGRAVILRYGKYVFFNEKHLIHAEKWFENYGDKAIFFGRILPVMRTFISFPAGIGKMDFKKFTIYTSIGSLPWCFILTYAGVMLREHWRNIWDIFHKLDLIIGILIVLIVVWIFIVKRKREII